MQVRNKSDFFSHICGRKINHVPDTSSYSYFLQKQDAYFIRNYYHYLDCVSRKSGACYFYTFTYNNNNRPCIFGNYSIDNNDFLYLVRDSPLKYNLKKHNTAFKFFATSELGNGKGSRGYANNPHFHVLFYLTPIDVSKPIIDSSTFKAILESIWQGDFNNPKLYNKGICKPGDNNGLVDSVAGLRYVCKYVCKDPDSQAKVRSIKSSILSYIDKRLLNMRMYTKLQNKVSCWDTAYKFHKYFVHYLFDRLYKKDFNRYTPKVHCSHGLGDYALNFIDFSNYTIPCLDSKGVVKSYPIPLFYQRKLFYDKIPHKDYIIYQLNPDGVKFKKSITLNLIPKLTDKFISLLPLYKNSPYYNSDICNVDVHRYTLYTLIYSQRIIPYSNFNIDINPLSDLDLFLEPTNNYITPNTFNKYIYNHLPTYEAHPYFSPFLTFFNTFSDFLDAYEKEQSDLNFANYYDKKKVANFHNSNRMSAIYGEG